MRSFPGCVGLAAPQLDELVRMVVVDVSEPPEGAALAHGLLVLANPRLVDREGAEVAREGCLSIPHLTANVRRATRIVIEALDARLEPVEVESEGFEARCLLHEIDHLDGLLFLDRVDSLATRRVPAQEPLRARRSGAAPGGRAPRRPRTARPGAAAAPAGRPSR